MKNQNNVANLKVAEDPAQETESKKEIYRFEIFHGVTGNDGKIRKINQMGTAALQEGMVTYLVKLKTLLAEQYFLLPDKKKAEGNDFVILTREPALISGRKYFWNKVGVGKILDGVNKGLVQLKWDLFDKDVYMSLYPKSPKSGYEEAPDFEAA